MTFQPLVRVNETDGYVDKLVKLVPAEAVSAYTALIAIATDSGSAGEAAWAFFIALGILLVARIFGSINFPEGKRVSWTEIDWIMVSISIISLALWAYTIGGSTSGPFKGYYTLFWGTALIILFTFLAPYFYTGTKKTARAIRGNP
jgi:hypothetical protein